MPVFNVLAALLAILMLVRHGRRALDLLRPAPPVDPDDPDDPDARGAPGARAGAVIPLLNCIIAGAVLWVAVKGLLSGLMNHPGGTP